MADPGYVARVIVWRADLARWEGVETPGQSLPALPTKIEMEDLLDWLEAGHHQEEERAKQGGAPGYLSR
jgi:hypothetical protein